MSERAATQEVAAERFVMVVIEQIRNVGAGGDGRYEICVTTHRIQGERSDKRTGREADERFIVSVSARSLTRGARPYPPDSGASRPSSYA